ncbi:MAG: hypothetical protein AAGJ10_11835 [Bacteroidota bacterium]
MSLLRSTWCRPVDHRWSVHTLTLFSHRLVLRSWSWRGRTTRVIWLDELVEVGLWPQRLNLTLHLYTGEVVKLHVPGAALWRLAIAEACQPHTGARRWSPLASPPPPSLQP